VLIWQRAATIVWGRDTILYGTYYMYEKKDWNEDLQSCNLR